MYNRVKLTTDLFDSVRIARAKYDSEHSNDNDWCKLNVNEKLDLVMEEHRPIIHKILIQMNEA